MSQAELIRTDYLTVQYVWALENEQVFMARAKHEVDRGNYDRFRMLVLNCARPIRRLLDDTHADSIGPYEWAFLTLELWCRLGGRLVHFPRPTDEDAFTIHVERLRIAGYGFSRNGIFAIEPANPCAEVSIGQPQLCTLNPEPIQEKPVSNQIIIKNLTLINDVDVRNMSDEQLIDAIKKVEKEVEELKSVKTKSDKIAKKIADANDTLTVLVGLLDGR